MTSKETGPPDRVAPVFAAERRRRILDHLHVKGSASLRELVELTESSEVTARRDLRALEADGLLSRRHGGAMSHDGAPHEPSYAEKAQVAADEKAAIAALALGMIAAGDAIVLGAGTTTQALAKRLVRFHDLTVVTNSLLVAQALVRARGVDVVMTGGTLRGSIHALVGSDAEQSLSGLRTVRAFLSGNGLTAERGLTTPSLVVANVDRALAATAGEVVVLADHTKIGRDTMVQTVPVDRMAHLITDEGADPSELARIARAGVQVQRAGIAS
ncbi:MAG: DeoR/GlpR transcriptional regulator [Solirubrobacterales bacterium]|nr:DeoR/GlpR transcriptional regulator [Solirubrobacterales bacterium]